ncbi:hypothetical protein [Streptomyces sp. NPDC014623]
MSWTPLAVLTLVAAAPPVLGLEGFRRRDPQTTQGTGHGAWTS